MSREFPDFIDPWRLAAGNKEIGGTIPLARLTRLVSLLDSPEGEASFSIRFGFDEQRRARAVVTVEASLTLICQASLKPYTEHVQQNSQLLILGDAAEQANLSDHEEFVLVEEGRVATADLVEDELLLAVPQVPRNPDLQVILASTSGEIVNEANSQNGNSVEGRQRPFESLAELMKDR